MAEPMVCAIMLVNGRDAMARRAIASFHSQTYQRKRLVVWDTGRWGPPALPVADDVMWPRVDGSYFKGATIGALRNAANKYALALARYTTNGTRAEVLVHWDSDDWSHPRRIEEQVKLLEASGKDCVGYREVLFWDTRHACQQPLEYDPGEARIYTDPDWRGMVGASMCYYGKAWEDSPFVDAPHEDRAWWLANASKCKGVSSLTSHDCSHGAWQTQEDDWGEPRLICEIHGANTETAAYSAEAFASSYWRLAPDYYQERCAKTMALTSYA